MSIGLPSTWGGALMMSTMLAEPAARNLRELSKSSFEAAVNSPFLMQRPDGAPLALELVQYKLKIETKMQECFALLFKAPLVAPPLQDTYTLQHAALGTLELFLVPVKQTDDGLFFEAVFNRLLA
jgi:hypothetical protein